jgi:hypothetical protein
VKLQDLPALRKRAGRKARGKYNAIKVEADGYTFDSKAEFRYYLQLRYRGVAGLIVHPGFDLGSCYYKADFAHDWDGGKLVIDVKGKQTADNRIKIKLMREKYGIDVLLVTKESNPEIFKSERRPK